MLNKLKRSYFTIIFHLPDCSTGFGESDKTPWRQQHYNRGSRIAWWQEGRNSWISYQDIKGRKHLLITRDQAGSYLSVASNTRPGVCLLSLDEMLVQLSAAPALNSPERTKHNVLGYGSRPDHSIRWRAQQSWGRYHFFWLNRRLISSPFLCKLVYGHLISDAPPKYLGNELAWAAVIQIVFFVRQTRFSTSNLPTLA